MYIYIYIYIMPIIYKNYIYNYVYIATISQIHCTTTVSDPASCMHAPTCRFFYYNQAIACMQSVFISAAELLGGEISSPKFSDFTLNYIASCMHDMLLT